MKREAMASILDDFIIHIGKIHEERHRQAVHEMRKLERCLYGTLVVAACSLIAVVVMAVTR